MGFSTLYGSKWVATRSATPVPSRVSGFSTLYGSKWVATLKLLRLVSGLLGFSTLYGSKWVATFLSITTSCVVFGFSTLYGSKWVATGKRAGAHRACRKFQYPLRVEVGCNYKYLAPVWENLWFQYPLRVEVGCNLQDKLFSALCNQRFSTLYGSKWVATVSAL